MSLAKERSIAHEPPFLMNALDNPLSPKSQYSSSPDHQEFDKDKRSNGSDQDGRSVIDFRAFLMSSSSSSTDQSLLSFDPKEDQMISGGYNHWNNNNHNNSRFSADYSNKGNQNNGSSSADGSSYGWLCSDQSTVTTDNSFDESGGTQESTGYNNKRPNMGEISTQAAKKQCSTGSTNSATNSKKPKDQKPSHVSKDRQSIAAKNRRERISERLKVLQELVPNGSKVDLVTMLEKAIGYVKFLQLQVKVLATDEFWPVQGGKAPDISQVKEAIDAILSSPSQRERNSCSK